MFTHNVRTTKPLKRVAVELADGRTIRPAVRELHPPPTQQQLAEHQARVEAALGSIRESLVDLEQRRQQSLAEMQQLAVELSVEIAAQVINQQLETNQSLAVGLAERAIARLNAAGETTLLLHPDDAAVVQAAVQESEAMQAEFQNVTIAGHPALPRGACQAESSQFGVRIDPASHLETIRQTLLEQLDDAQTERRTNEAGSRGMRRFPDRRETA